MEERAITKQHKVLLNNRKTGNLTGILDVLSFDLSEVMLETELGMLQVQGKDLHVNRLNLEKGEVDIDGQIESFRYSDVTGISGKSFWGKLFK